MKTAPAVCRKPPVVRTPSSGIPRKNVDNMIVLEYGTADSLAYIEQHLRQAPGFDDPRIHFALTCASVGCPALRPEAYQADRLDVQLDDQVSRFLSDRSRNRFSTSSSATAYVSPIFRWYSADFEAEFHGIKSVRGFLARYAAALGDSPADRAQIASGEFALEYTVYDWTLNAMRQFGRVQ